MRLGPADRLDGLLHRAGPVEPELAQRDQEVLLAVGEGLLVPARLALEGRAPAHHPRVEDHRGRPAVVPLRALRGRVDLLEVVPPRVDHVPLERGELLRERLDRHHVVRPAVDLRLVLVDEHRQVVEAVVPGRHDRFPALPFLQLAVADVDPHPRHQVPARRREALEPVAPERERHPDADGEPLAERPGPDLDAGDVEAVRVALEVGAGVAERVELRAGDEPAVREEGVEHGRAVPVREDEPVAVGVLRLLRVEAQLVEEEVRQVVGRGEGPSGVPRVRDVGHRHDVAADLPRDLGELGKRLVLSRRHRLVLRPSRGMKARSRSPAKASPTGPSPWATAAPRAPHLRRSVRAGRKPGPVPLRATAIGLGPPLPAASNGLPWSPAARAAPCRPCGRRPPLFGLSPGGACRAGNVAVPAVGSYPAVSPLPDPRGLAVAGPSAVCFLLRFPWACARWALPTTRPCGARTFLGGLRPRGSPARSDGADSTTRAPRWRRGSHQFPSCLWSFHQSRNCFARTRLSWPVSDWRAFLTAAP